MPEMNEQDTCVHDFEPYSRGQSWTSFDPVSLNTTTPTAPSLISDTKGSEISTKQPTDVTKATTVVAAEHRFDNTLQEAQIATKATYKITTEIVRQAMSYTDFVNLCRSIVLSQPVQNAIQGTLPTSTPPRSSATGGEFEYPTMFRHVCLCDPKLNGSPIRYRSKNFSIGPRSVKAGQYSLVDTETQLPPTEGNIVLNVRLDSGRRPCYILEYTMPLLSSVYREARWILASQMDITDIVTQLSIRLLVASDSPASSRSETSGQSIANIATKIPCSGTDTYESDLEEEQPFLTECHTQLGSFDIVSDEPNLLDFQDLVEDIRYYHRDSFVMTESVHDAFWTVSWLSPSLLEGHDALQNCTINLRGSDLSVLIELGRRLDGNVPFSINIKWGSTAEGRRMYAVPMWCSNSERCYMCFLIPDEFPLLRTFYEC